MASYSGNKKVASETVYVLNDKYQYVAFDQTVNAKWLDLENVLSVKRDKTIYAIRARNTFDFKNNSTNSEFFCNASIDYTNALTSTTTFSSNVFRNFQTIKPITNEDNIFLSDTNPMYGNLLSDDINKIGLGGSLNSDFVYTNRLTGNINVSSSINVFRDGLNVDASNASDLSGNLRMNGLIKSLGVGPGSGFVQIANSYSNRVLKYSDNTTNSWNRLINANVNGNIMVTASTDPCDMYGNPITFSPINQSGNLITNEAYRLQFALKKNETQTRSTENPIYIGRVSRFGTNLTDISGTLSKNLAVHSFSSNFFSSLPADNSIYTNANVLTQITVNGNYTNAPVQVFNTNYSDGNVSNLNSGNLLVSPSFITSVTVNSYDNSFYGDYIANPDLTTNLNAGDRFTVVQSNIGLTKPLYLFDRVIPSSVSSDYVNPSQIFGGASTADTPSSSNQDLFCANALYKNIDGTNVVDSKVVYMQFYGVVSDNWKTDSKIVSSSLNLPKGTKNPNMSNYNSGNIVDMYLRRGGINLDNYVNVTTKNTSGSKYFSTIPSYLKSYEEPSTGIYIQDETVCANDTPTLSNPSNQRIRSFSVDSSTSINGQVTKDLCFYVFGNTQEDDRINKTLPVVLAGKDTTNSIIASVWTYDVNGDQNSSTVKFSPKVVYGALNTGSTINPSSGIALPSGGTVKALTLANDFSKTNITYKVKFGKVLGETNLTNEMVTPDNFGFYANLTLEGTPVSPTLTSVTNLKLINNSHMNDLLLNGVAFSEFEFSNFSYKFTDLGNIMNLNNSNYKFTSVLPAKGNNGLSFSTINDNFINVIADYNGTEIVGENSDVHRLSVYDTHYRFYINDVQRTGAGPLNNSYRSGTSTDIVGNLFNGAQGVITQGPLDNSYINPGNFVLFTYEKVYENSSKDSFYPFYSVNDTLGRTNDSVLANDNYLFPGFVYKKNGADAEFYNYKDETNVDFIIANNASVEQSLSLIFFGIDTTNKTVKVALSSESGTKSIDIKPIRFGKNTYYSPIVFKISGETNSYAVLLYKVSDSVGNDLSGDYRSYLPTSVNMRVIEKSSDGQNQIQFKTSLRVYSGNDIQSTYSNNIVSQKTKLSLFSYSSAFGSNDTNIGINVFSIPPNNTFIQMAYTKSVLKKVISYSRSDYELNNNVDYDLYKSDDSKLYSKIPSSISGILFATSKSNSDFNVSVEDDDKSLPKIPANSTRFYLDQGYSNGVYIDVDNNSTLTPDKLGKFRINRSVEWILTRMADNQTTEETVGRGLMSRTSTPDDPEDINGRQDYFIFENLGKLTSGFYMKVNTNIIDLASHLLVQNKQNGKYAAQNEFVLKTKSDSFVVGLYHENPDTYVKTHIISKLNSNGVINLSDLFAYTNPSDSKVLKSRLPKFEFEHLRGLTFGRSITDLSNSIFRIKLRLDNYCVVHNKLAVSVNDILYSVNSGVTGGNVGVEFTQNLLNPVSINTDFISVTTPALTNDTFNLISSYTHQGFGKVKYQFVDFTSNYDNELPTEYFVPTGSALKPYYYPTNKAFSFTAPSTFGAPVDILFDTTNSRFYVNLGNSVNVDKVYFAGTGLTSQPQLYNNKSTALLYTGTRPLGFITYERTSTISLNDFMKSTPLNFQSNQSNSNKSVFNSTTRNEVFQVTTDVGYNVYYSVALTNSSATGKINVRGISYDLSKQMYLTSTLQSHCFGVCKSSQHLINGLTLNCKYGVEQTHQILLTPVYKGNSYLPTLSDNDLYASLNNKQKYIQFQVNGAAGSTNPLFTLQLLGATQNTKNFSVSINPSKLYVYEAIDVNDNGELDITKSEGADATTLRDRTSQQNISNDFGLTNSFSELLFDLKSGQTTGSYRRPALVQTITLSDDFANITGSGMDIKLNKKWAIGYNLDCFFVIRHNNLATFDVITIETDNQSNVNNTTSSSLKVGNTTPLIIGNSGDWARKRANTSSALPNSGLTFKINKDVKINVGDVVKIFVDNTPVNNTISLDVSVAGKANTTYTISDYDQEAYSRLLDTQVRTNNKLK
jgi:hypothetical protein